jgi:hypothetical protein
MTSRSSLLLGSAAVLAFAGLLGCGGNVTIGDGGGGAGGGTTTGSGGNTTTTGTGGGTTTTTITGTPTPCETLDHISCLNAYPSCVPVYDDKCCPTCDMGGCADCINIQFHHCAPYTEQCTGAPTICGNTPGWACDGKQADCNIDPGGSTAPCATVPGCLPTYCSLTLESCPGDPVCHPATKGTCLNQCNSPPPPCPNGTYPESDGLCYTGYCVPQDVCVTGL